MAISPAGNHVAFVGSRGGVRLLYVRALDSLEAKPLPGTDGAICMPFFSPDGQWLGFFAVGKLKKISIQGGAPVTLMNAMGSYGASWGPDDSIIFSAVGTPGLTRISAAGGTPQLITTVDSGKGEAGHRWPLLLPDGRTLLFAIEGQGPADLAQIVAQRLDSGERRVLVEGGTYPGYVPTGYLVYVRQGELMAAPFDWEKLELTGPSFPVSEQARQSNRGAAQYGISRSGSLVYVPGDMVGNDFTLVWVDRKGNAQPLAAPPRHYNFPHLSPDGKRVLVQSTESNADVWLYDIPGDALSRLTFEGMNETPVWSPEGDRLTFCSSRAGGPYNLFWKLVDGSGPVEPLTAPGSNPRCPHSWSPDGKYLAFFENHPTNGFDIWVLPMEGDRKPRPFLQTPAREQMPAFSPDGRWLAYVSDESGRREVYVQPFPGPGEKQQISADGGIQPRWARSGRELFYRNGNKMMAVDVNQSRDSNGAVASGFSMGKPRLLFEGPYESQINAVNYDVTPDGQRFLMLKPSEQPATQINVVLNWFEDLKRRVPSGN